MALYSPKVYETLHAKYTKVQCQNGGRKRAATARRDRFGRMLPNNYDLPAPNNHDLAGGQARIIKALRDEHGRFKAKS